MLRYFILTLNCPSVRAAKPSVNISVKMYFTKEEFKVKKKGGIRDV